MGTMNISLPHALRSFVDEQVASRGYGTASEYIRELLRKDRDRRRLHDLLLDGAASASTAPADEAYFDGLRARADVRTGVSTKEVVPRVLARRDVEEAVDHYLKEAGGTAALGFIDEIERAFRHIACRPAAGSPRYAHELDLPGLGAWPVKRYPYLVFYVEREHSVDVWRVLHGKRDVPAWIDESEAG